MPFLQPDALCVKSQDVYVIRSILPTKAKQTEEVGQRQEGKVQVDRKLVNHKREMRRKRR